MKIALLFTWVAACVVPALNAQQHLVPEPGLLAEYDEYHDKIRKVFAVANKDDVLCRVVILGSFAPEQVVGVRKTAVGHEVFSMTPSSESTIWDIELVRLYEEGKIIGYDKQMKKLPLEKVESYQALKKRTQTDLRKITATVKAVIIDEVLALRIAAIWKKMLLAVRQPEKPHSGLDGGSYHFSMFVLGRGFISGQVWSPDEKTKPAALVDLAEQISECARGGSTEEALRETVSLVEKITQE